MRRLILLLLLTSTAQAQTVTDWNERLTAWGTILKQNGRLPAWASLDDYYSIVFAPGNLKGALCLVDATTKQRFPLYGDVLRARRMIMGQTAAWTDSLAQPIEPDPALRALGLCDEFFAKYPPPPPPVPTALGEPRYRATVENPLGTLDWVAMNRDYVMGTTTVGQACGTKLRAPSGSADPKVAWHNHPAGGITRCKTP